MDNTLDFLLKSHDLSKQDLAESIGVTRQTINRIANGHPPSMAVGMKIAAYFKKDVQDIFFSPKVKHVAQNQKSISA